MTVDHSGFSDCRPLQSVFHPLTREVSLPAFASAVRVLTATCVSLSQVAACTSIWWWWCVWCMRTMHAKPGGRGQVSFSIILCLVVLAESLAEHEACHFS